MNNTHERMQHLNQYSQKKNNPIEQMGKIL